LRAREIWLCGSNTTRAPAARAISAVRSVELLSQTTSSQPPAASKARAAALMFSSVPASSRSSLNAGTTTDSFRRGAS